MEFLRRLRAGFDQYAPGAGAWLPWVGGVLMVLAAVVAAGAWYGARPYLRATATVTENVSDMSGRQGVLYSPRLRFRAADGGIVQVVVSERSDEIEFPAGTAVAVLYPAGEPARVRIATVWRVYGTGIGLGLLGVAVFDVGLVLKILVRRGRAVL